MSWLQNWVPPNWLKPWMMAILTIAIFVLAGFIYAKSLVVIWPLIGLLGAIGVYHTGSWNYGDPFSGQVFLFVMMLLIPPFTIYFLFDDLHEAKKYRTA